MYGHHGCGGNLARQENRALKREARAESREAHLHNKAMNQALHGNFGRAANLEMKANSAHHKAEHERFRADAFHLARGHQHHHAPHCHPTPHYPHHSPTTVVVHHHVPATPPLNYPTGTVAPPPTGPPPAYQVAATTGYPAAPTGYPPVPTGYPAAPIGYPAAPSGYPAAPTGYPAAPTGYPAASTGYPAAPTGYPTASPYPAQGASAYPNPYQ